MCELCAMCIVNIEIREMSHGRCGSLETTDTVWYVEIRRTIDVIAVQTSNAQLRTRP